MRIIRIGNPIKERTYLVLIDIFILMCAMGVSLGILFITLNPDFGLYPPPKTEQDINPWGVEENDVPRQMIQDIDNIIKKHFRSGIQIKEIQRILKHGWGTIGNDQYVFQNADSISIFSVTGEGPIVKVAEKIWNSDEGNLEPVPFEKIHLKKR